MLCDRADMLYEGESVYTDQGYAVWLLSTRLYVTRRSPQTTLLYVLSALPVEGIPPLCVLLDSGSSNSEEREGER